MSILRSKKFLLFWISQSISQLGSAMTSYTLIIWVFKQTQSAMDVSLIAFCTYLPMVITSAFAGSYVDTHNKKRIMLYSDFLAAACTCIVGALIFNNSLKVWHIYIINTIIGFMNAFQTPASTVVIGLIVPQDEYDKASGLNSFSNSLITVVMPMLATVIVSFWGMGTVIFADLLTFLIAWISLMFFIKIPENFMISNENVFENIKLGFHFLKQEKGIGYLVISMAALNFFSNITYENILTPMILARTNGNNIALGIVSGILGAGGIIGGIIVAFVSIKKNVVKVIYISAAVSFLFGDFLMGIGNNVFVWGIAALAASVPIPFVTAGQNVILFKKVPYPIQGRVFAIRNAFQYCTIPVAIILGGYLADHVFEPMMKNYDIPILTDLLGNNAGSGMALMFTVTSVLGFISSVYWYNNREINKL